jgi:hypothetical protein
LGLPLGAGRPVNEPLGVPRSPWGAIGGTGRHSRSDPLPLTFLVMPKYPPSRAQDDTTNTIIYAIVIIDEYDLSSLADLR